MEKEHLSEEMLIIFTRYPLPGQTKTRLIPALGAKKAAILQKMMAEHTFMQCEKLARERKLSIEVHCHGGNNEEVKKWVPQSFLCRRQCHGTLGDKLAHSFAQGFALGSRKIITIGTDCPFLSKPILVNAFALLENHDVVLGPTLDGGYYLIGLNKAENALFEHIEWGTEKVLNQTIDIARKKRKVFALLPQLADIDRPEDLELLIHAGFTLDLPLERSVLHKFRTGTGKGHFPS